MDEEIKEIQKLKETLSTREIPEVLKERIYVLLERVSRSYKYSSYSSEFESASRYINWVLSVPWGLESEDNMDINNAKSILDKNHYGMNSIKERILEYIAVMNLIRSKKSTEYNAPIICFVGLQGIGKTSMSRSISEALGRSFQRISLGGMPSALELLGRSKAIVDSEPGAIVKALIKSRSMNPVILLDEVDKCGSDLGSKASVMASLLEILDPEQNKTFMDNYIDYPIDLSKVLFVLTANNLGPISNALLDRLELLRMTGYTDKEKEVIASEYILPKLYKSTGITENQLTFSPDVWPFIIRPLGYEAGIRELERILMGIGRKVAKKVLENQQEVININRDNYREFIDI